MTAPGGSIVFLITGLGRGGAEAQLARLAGGLHDRGWDVRVVTLLPDMDHGAGLAARGIQVVSMGLSRPADGPRAVRELVRALRVWKPVALVSFLFHSNLVGRVVGRMVRIPVVVSSERSDRYGGRYRYWLLRLTDGWADATHTNSRSVGERLVREKVIRPERLRVIPNSIAAESELITDLDRAEVRSRLGVSPGEFLWLAVGRVDWAKDYPTLLRAFARTVDRDRTCLRVAGDGAEDPGLAELVEELGLSRRVRLLGHREDVPELLAAADGFVMSSRLEGFPNALMEALVSGLPVVVTRVGGIPELVRDGESGYIVPPRDPEALADAMQRLMRLPRERREQMGRAGRERTVAECAPGAVLDRWEGMIRELLEAKGVAVPSRVSPGGQPVRSSEED